MAEWKLLILASLPTNVPESQNWGEIYVPTEIYRVDWKPHLVSLRGCDEAKIAKSESALIQSVGVLI